MIETSFTTVFLLYTAAILFYVQTFFTRDFSLPARTARARVCKPPSLPYYHAVAAATSISSSNSSTLIDFSLRALADKFVPGQLMVFCTQIFVLVVFGTVVSSRCVPMFVLQSPRFNTKIVFLESSEIFWCAIFN